MKKLLIAILVLFITVGTSYAFQESESSGEKTVDTLIYTAGLDGVRLTAVLIITDGTNDATAIIYDNTSAAGKKIFEATVVGSANYGGRNFPFPVAARTGLYLELTGTGASAIIEFIK